MYFILCNGQIAGGPFTILYDAQREMIKLRDASRGIGKWEVVKR